jgi:hypothetical protein
VGFLAEVEGVEDVSQSGRQVIVRGLGALLALVAAALVRRGMAPLDLGARRASLEDVYLQLTGARERAGEGP